MRSRAFRKSRAAKDRRHGTCRLRLRKPRASAAYGPLARGLRGGEDSSEAESKGAASARNTRGGAKGRESKWRARREAWHDTCLLVVEWASKADARQEAWRRTCRPRSVAPPRLTRRRFFFLGKAARPSAADALAAKPVRPIRERWRTSQPRGAGPTTECRPGASTASAGRRGGRDPRRLYLLDLFLDV